MPSSAVKHLIFKYMEKRYEGFLASNGLYVLDTFSGEVKFISHEGIVEAKPELNNPIISSLTQTTVNSEKKDFTPFEQEVVSAYPYLIARPFSDLLKETDPRMKCKLMVDTFTAILKYLSLQLASEYIRVPELKDLQIHQTLTKDLSRPLISAWNLLIARSLPVFRDKGIQLFSPEMRSAYEKLESKCKDPFLLSQSYSDEHGNIKTKTKKLGKIQALINYRNGLAHGFNQSKERAQKEFDEYYPLLCDILQEVRFVSRYTLWHVESSKNGVNGIRLMGSNPSQSKVDFTRDGINPSISPLFIINDSTGEILPLYAFFDVEQTNEIGLPEMGKDVFVFEGSTKNTLIYLSSSGEHLEKTTRFEHWKDLLAQKQMDVEIIDEKNLSREILHSLGKHISYNAIQALITSGKYLREATVERQDLNEYLDSFCSSAFNGFVLGGESGIGKSTLLAQKTELWQDDGHMVLFYRGSALNQTDIASKFLRDCALKLNYLEDFLSLADNIFSKANLNCYLIIDALNEYSGNINDLIKSIENMVAQSSNYRWFKVIVSIRDSAYSRTISKFGEIATNNYYKVEEEKNGEKISSNVVRLKPLAKKFTEQLYNAYRDFKWKDSVISEDEGFYKYRPLTTFSELEPNGTTLELLRSPLMTRLILQSFHRSKLPSQLKNDEAMRLYLDNIVVEKTNESAGFPERLKLLNLLVREFDKQNTERIERDTLIKMDAFKTYLINAQKDSPYIQLLELGVLMEEWEKDDCFVRFAFDRFLEFMLAELHFSKVNDAMDVLNLFKRISEFKILQGAVEMIVLRFCNNDQSDVLIDLSDLVDQETQEIKRLATEIIANILFSLAKENKIHFESVIQRFPENPGNTDLDILISLVDKFYTTGNFESFISTMQIAQQEANLLKNNKVLSDLMLFDSQLDMMQGRYSNAKEKLIEVIKNKTEHKDYFGLTKSYIELAKLEKYLNNKVSSHENNIMALELAKANEFLLLQAEVLNNIAISKKGKKMIEDAISLYDESFVISTKIGDRTGIAKILHNKANILKANNRLNEAKLMYFESLEILRSLGDKRRIAFPLTALGDIKVIEGKIEEAKELFLESLSIRRKLDDKKGICTSLTDIARLNFNQGKTEEAEQLYKECLDIRIELGEKKGISNALNRLGILNFEVGELAQSKAFYLEALMLESELNEPPGIIGTIHRAFSLFDDSERKHFFTIAKALLNESSEPNQLSQFANLDLMQYCLSNKKVEKRIIQEKIKYVKIQKVKSTLNELADLPIEAYYLSVQKLNEIGEHKMAKVLAKETLKMIGVLKSIRKDTFNEIAISVAPIVV